MHVLIWVTEGTWPATVDAARAWVTDDTQVTLLHVTSDEPAAAARGAFAGLLGRGYPPGRDPGSQLDALSATAAEDLLRAAEHRLARPVTALQRHGRVEREVIQAAAGADLLLCARDGDLSRLGPHSLAPPTRFVVDHAPCPVLLIWPGSAPSVDAIPPPPHHLRPHP
jgi:nucleotide-binding universal stress UspA family protein